MALASDFQAKHARCTDLMQAKGLSRSEYDPFVLRWLRFAGLPVVPPCFLPFWKIALIYSVVFGVCFAIGGWVLNTFLSRDFAPHLVVAPVSGLLFGLFIAFWMKRWVTRLNLPRWEDI